MGVAAPLTGPVSWGGGATLRGVELAVAHVNAAGGVLGEQIELVTADDFCDAEQAVAAANKLLAHGIKVVIGHECSDAAIPASAVYADAGVLMMAYGASNPTLTEQGFDNVFRVGGRDDVQGPMAADHLAEHWGGKAIAILHDGEAYGRGLAEETKEALNARGVSEAMFAAIEPGLVDYFDVVETIQENRIDVVYYAGRPPELGVLARQLRAAGTEVELIAGDAIVTEDYGLIAGEAGEGTLFTAFRDARSLPRAAEMVADYRAKYLEWPEGVVLLAYAAVQAWAQAVEQAGTLELDAAADSLRTNEFDTILGTIGFDEKGDTTGYEPFTWYVWRGSIYEPVNPAELTD